MSEHGPKDEFENQADQLQWLVDTCRFLAFRPDKAGKQLENLAIANTYQGCESSRFRLDGESVLVIADYPESTWGDMVAIETTGAPQRDAESQWFAVETAYTIKLDTRNEESEEPAELTIAMERQDIYKDLDGALLPEQYEQIKEEYDTQRLARRDVVEGLEPSEMPNSIDREAYRGARLTSILEMFRTGDVFSPEELAERALRDIDGGEKLRPYAEALEKKDSEMFRREIENMQLQEDLGFSEVGDEELENLIEKLKRLRSDPDTFDIGDYSPAL